MNANTKEFVFQHGSQDPQHGHGILGHCRFQQGDGAQYARVSQRRQACSSNLSAATEIQYLSIVTSIHSGKQCRQLRISQTMTMGFLHDPKVHAVPRLYRAIMIDSMLKRRIARRELDFHDNVHIIQDIDKHIRRELLHFCNPGEYLSSKTTRRHCVLALVRGRGRESMQASRATFFGANALGAPFPAKRDVVTSSEKRVPVSLMLKGTKSEMLQHLLTWRHKFAHVLRTFASSPSIFYSSASNHHEHYY